METSSINEGHVSLLALKAKQVAPLVAFVEVFGLVQRICRPASGQRFRKCLLFYICIINGLCSAFLEYEVNNYFYCNINESQ